MKTLMIAVVTFAMVSCTGQTQRHTNMSNWRGSDMKRVDHGPKRPDMKRRERPDNANHRQRGEGVQRDGMRERYAEAGRRLRIAVKEGKLTKEEAREKFEALRKRGDRKAN